MTKQVQTLNGLWVNQPELTEAEKNSPLYKYFEQPLADVDPAVVAQVQQLDAKDVLLPENLNELLNDGYLSKEIGYAVLENGMGYVSSMVQMPDVTPEMWDWWFCWHPFENLRYKIWDNKVHFGTHLSDEHLARLADTRLPYRERLIGTHHFVREDIGGGAEDLDLIFQTPAEFGFDTERYEQKAVASVMAKVLGGAVKMCHVARLHNSGKGIELRTRFWFFLPQTPLEVMKNLNFHAVEEYTNLASILPKVFAEFGHLPVETKLVKA